MRIPGARIHIDPDPVEGYLRAVTGDLEFSTTAWRNAPAQPPDTTAPVVSNVRASQEKVTIAAVNRQAPIFTPNGDGLSDTIGISYRLSEDAFLAIKVKRAGRVVRRTSAWAQAGPGTVAWNGRNDNAKYVPEGNYNVYLTPTDRAGNQGASKRISAKVLNSVRNPSVSRTLFWARDGDRMAASSTLKARLIRPATVSWIIRDRKGKVVRRGIPPEQRSAGVVRFVWNGQDDRGRWVPDGKYTARVRVTTSMGSYAHDVVLRHMPFQAYTPSWTRRRGDTVTLRITTAEPLQGQAGRLRQPARHPQVRGSAPAHHPARGRPVQGRDQDQALGQAGHHEGACQGHRQAGWYQRQGLRSAAQVARARAAPRAPIDW